LVVIATGEKYDIIAVFVDEIAQYLLTLFIYDYIHVIDDNYFLFVRYF
jgi:hypothetical protein